MGYDGPRCRLRVVVHMEAGRLLPSDIVQLEAENGAAYVWPLAAAGFAPGDLVEVRRVEKAVDGPAK